MHETIKPVKRTLRISLYAGAGFCCLVGICAVCVLITNFRAFEGWFYMLALVMNFICVSFAPAYMLLKGLKTRTRHWVLIIIAEAIVIAFVLFFMVANYVRA